MPYLMALAWWPQAQEEFPGAFVDRCALCGERVLVRAETIQASRADTPFICLSCTPDVPLLDIGISQAYITRASRDLGAPLTLDDLLQRVVDIRHQARMFRDLTAGRT